MGRVVVREFGTESGNFGKEEFALDTSGVGVVEYRPYGDLMFSMAFVCTMSITHEIFELPSGLLDNAILTFEDDAHSR